MMRKFFTFYATMMLSGALFGQISFNNASFEGEPQDATVPMGWQGCELGSTPDILPGSWGVYNESSDGNTYMGLITRKDGTFESVGQRISSPLKAKECYQFSMDLAHSKTYANYNMPIKLRIWGGQSSCSKDVLLGEAQTIDHTKWERYEYSFITEVQINYIILEAYYMDGLFFNYNGNILIDNLSVLKPCQRADLGPLALPRRVF